MNELGHLIIDSHQVFLGLLGLGFTALLLLDLKDHYITGIQGRKFLCLFFVTFFVGVFTLFYRQWHDFGPFLSLEFALMVVLAVVHPKFAIGWMVFLFLSRPWEALDEQMMSSIPRDVSYLTILSMLGHKFIKKRFYFRFNAGTFFLLAFAAWLFLSGFFSNHALEALAKYEEIFSKGVILFLLMQNCLDDPDDIHPVKIAFVLAILEKSFISYYKSNIMEQSHLVEEANSRLESVGMLSNSNDIAAIFVLVIPFAVFFLIKSNLRPFNWLLGIVTAGIMSLLVWQSGSRGALLGIFAIIGSYCMIKIKSRKILVTFLALGMLGTIASFSLMSRNAEDLDGSTENRVLYWKAGLNMAIKNPLFGVGFWGFPKNLVAYAPDGNVGSEQDHMTAHSSWVLVLAEGGPMALMLFLALWTYALWAAWKMRSTQPEYLMALAGYGLAITFLSHSYMLFPYIVLALVITHYNISKNFATSRRQI